jgi:hypothetical protein
MANEAALFEAAVHKNIWSFWSKMMRHNKKLIYAWIITLVFSFAFTTSVKGAPPAKQEESTSIKSAPAAGQEETIAGTVVKTDKGIVIEAEDGDYIVKGKDLSKMVGKMIEATGVITESDKGDVIEVKSYEEIQE